LWKIFSLVKDTCGGGEGGIMRVNHCIPDYKYKKCIKKAKITMDGACCQKSK